MTTEIVLPSLSAGMEDAVIAKWLVHPGDRVEPGQVLAEVETDKATMELEAAEAGVVGRLNVATGQRADVGAVLALLLAEGEALPEAAPPAAPASAEQAPAPHPPVPDLPGERRHPASPLARRMAAQAGLDLAGAQGSGPKGRIVKIDVERLRAASPAVAPSPVAPAGVQDIPAGIGAHEVLPVSTMRRTIARRLVEAKQRIPHFYLSSDCEIDALLALRAQLNEGRAADTRISVNDLIVKAAALALRAVPAANVIWNGAEILQLHDVDISVAVATEGGLMTPILRGADRMSLGTLSGEMRALAARARAGRLKPEEYQGGGFSVSNLGMYGVKSFSAIINPPQSCILAVGAAERRPVGRGEQIVLAEVMSLTLSVDHRSVDGALGAELLAAIKVGIEQPLGLLL
ncbi:MAG: dihydrolipoamide acetyltransferase family protein [Paenirhodobacter sp.]|uniref:dihydrolipoamide acetyltransferase family protein n=1 Tax=Paenirhodobacter sp. TaxID=1965326 RepID=UPI003D0C9A33